MAQKVFTLPERSSATQTHTVTIPNLKSVTSVKSDRGSASVTSVSGDSVTIKVSGGSYTRRVQTGGSYTPADSKTATGTSTLTSPSSTTAPAVTSFPATIEYSQGGYTGTLTKTGTTTYVEPVTGIDGKTYHKWAMKYSGTVTKPASDTRTYTYYYQYDVTVVYEDNVAPTVTVDSPTTNQTLYENDVLTISGTANDADTGNSVTVRYQVNAETVRAIDAFVADGSAKSFSKQLTFKGGSLYDGDTLIASNLTDGVAHTLKVYATDDQGGQSAITERTFYVVPNRAPSLTVNPPTTEGNTDGDKITINGNFADADGNQATVKYRINGGNGVQVTEGTNGDFEFTVSFAQLQIGQNSIVVEATDSYGSKTSRTVKLNKTAIETPILKSTARYKIEPPSGSATSVLLWVTRDENLQLEASISMTMKGEAESFKPVVSSNTAPSPDFENAVEDEFHLEADSPKDNIILQLVLTRTSLDVNPKIYLIQGVLE